MKNFFVLLKRIFTLQNIPTILAIVGSVILIVLQIPGILTQEQLFAGLIFIVGLVATSQLVEKVEKLSNIENLLSETTSLLRQQTKNTTSGLTLIQGHDECEAAYLRLVHGSKHRLISFALGIDISSDYWKVQIQPYLTAIETILKHGVKYQRLQVLEPAPIAWLKFIHKILASSEYSANVDIRFIDLPIDYYYHRIFQFFISDDNETALSVNIETASSDTEFIVCINDIPTNKALAEHFLKTSWSRSKKYTADELAMIIEEKIKLRTEHIRNNVGNYMSDIVKTDVKTLGIGVSLEHFYKIASPVALDEDLLRALQMQTFQLWNFISSMNNKANKLKAIKSWMSSGIIETFDNS